jgi:hypothetical protein
MQLALSIAALIFGLACSGPDENVLTPKQCDVGFWHKVAMPAAIKNICKR